MREEPMRERLTFVAVKNLRGQTALMVITILSVAGFQIFWLRQTYDREKRSLELKTEVTFRDAINNLQAENLNINILFSDSNRKEMIVAGKNNFADDIKVSVNEKKGLLSEINVISKKFNDTLRGKGLQKRIFIRHEKQTQFLDEEGPDSLQNKHDMVKLLYGLDSLQKPLQPSDVRVAIDSAFQKEHINVTYTLVTDTILSENKKGVYQAAYGFSKPTVFKMNMGNTWPYLMKRISMPLLFSVLLLAVTIASFLLLYKNLRRQKRLTEIKNEFIGNVTHELKTPIATVSVAIEALNNFDAIREPEKTKEYLGIASHELERLSLMVDKVLRLSMFESKAVELKKENFDLSVLIAEVMRSMQLQFEKTGAHTECKMKGNDFTVNADRMHIASVLYNLLDNAIKYSEKTPEIKVCIESMSDGFTVQITDEGIGIDPAYRNKIFEHFFRVPHGDLHNVKGYGLGLSYAAHIIEEHKGSIVATANEPKGTVFTVKLPRHAN